MADQKQKFSVIACMRNEGMFLLEWLSYYRAIGFDDIVVITNDCQDGTDTILDALAAADDGIHHIRNAIEPGEPPQVSGMRLALAHPVVQASDYVLHVDADEFLNITTGDGQISDLLTAVGPVDALAIAWRAFGNADVKTWEGGSILERFTRADRRIRPHITFHKCLFRPAMFGRAIDHMPKDPVAKDVTLKNTAGTALTPATLHHPTRARFKEAQPDWYTWENAALNHYALRSEDIFLMKNLRGRGMSNLSTKYHIGSTFWKRMNRNGARERTIQRHLPALQKIRAQFEAISNIAALDRAAFDWFVARRDSELTPERRAEWTRA